MFTGIVQAVGSLRATEPAGGDARLHIGTADLSLSGVALGDSIAVNGVCLTVQTLTEMGFWADVSRETLSLTTLGKLSIGTPLNLEKALTLQQPLGGHLMSGHVDGIGQLRSRQADARSERLRFVVPLPLARYVARKGSIAIDGVSLTVNQVEQDEFEVNLVPHTLAMTNLGRLQRGDAVNLEIDLIARYVERLFGERSIPDPLH